MPSDEPFRIGTRYHIEQDHNGKRPAYRKVPDISSMKYAAIADDDTTLKLYMTFDKPSLFKSFSRNTFRFDTLKTYFGNKARIITTFAGILNDIRKISPFPLYGFLVMNSIKIGIYNILQRLSKRERQSALAGLLISIVSNHVFSKAHDSLWWVDDLINEQYHDQLPYAAFKHLKAYNNLPLNIKIDNYYYSCPVWAFNNSVIFFTEGFRQMYNVIRHQSIFMPSLYVLKLLFMMNTGKNTEYYDKMDFSNRHRIQDGIFDAVKDPSFKRDLKILDATKKTAETLNNAKHHKSIRKPVLKPIVLYRKLNGAIIDLLDWVTTEYDPKSPITFNTFIHMISHMYTPKSEMLQGNSGISTMSWISEDIAKQKDFLKTKDDSLALFPLIKYEPSFSSGVKIDFLDVSYKYPSMEKFTLENVSFSVKPGQLTCVAGQNGSGKSTLVQLIAGMISPTTGNIFIDEIDIRRYDKRSLQKYISTLFIKTPSYCGLRYKDFMEMKAGDNPAPLEKALDKAQASHILEHLPKGLDTKICDEDDIFLLESPEALLERNAREICEDCDRVSETKHTPIHKKDKAAHFSGGEWQRLCLGRALQRQNATLYLLDEPTSQIDAETEKIIVDDMVSSKGHHNTFFITQRIYQTSKADQILYFDDGKLIEKGTFKELLQKKGKFAEAFDVSVRRDPYVDATED